MGNTNAKVESVVDHESQLLARLKQLQAEGLGFSHCIQVFGVDRDSDPHASAANEQYGVEGSLEFDDTLVVSESEDGGAYVLCWRWIEGVAVTDDDDESSDN